MASKIAPAAQPMAIPRTSDGLDRQAFIQVFGSIVGRLARESVKTESNKAEAARQEPQGAAA